MEAVGIAIREMCADFGVRLIKSWESENGAPLDSDEVSAFVAEALETYFKTSKATATVTVSRVAAPVSKEPKEPKGKATKKEQGESSGNGKAGKGGKPAKPKCQAVTSKGTPCSKCALENEPFCSVHLKNKNNKTETTVVVGESSSTTTTTKKTKGKGGKGISRGVEHSKKKHNHGLTSPVIEKCEVCEESGKPFEIPEYEAAAAVADRTEAALDKKDDEMITAHDLLFGNDDDDVDEDPDYSLEEEDFDEID